MSNITMSFFCGILTLFLSLPLLNAQEMQEEALSRGAVILAEKTDPVTFFGSDNQPLGKTPRSPACFCPMGRPCKRGREEMPFCFSVTERWLR